jgi:hypothetical protein
VTWGSRARRGGTCGDRRTRRRRRPGRHGRRCAGSRSNPRSCHGHGTSGRGDRGRRLRSGRCRDRWTCGTWGGRSYFRCGLLRRCGLSNFLGFRCFFGGGQAAEMLTHTFGVHEVDRTRVRLLFSDASFWEVLDQDFRLDFEFSSQFIDSDLIGICHSPLVLFATSYLGTAADDSTRKS